MERDQGARSILAEIGQSLIRTGALAAPWVFDALQECANIRYTPQSRASTKPAFHWRYRLPSFLVDPMQWRDKSPESLFRMSSSLFDSRCSRNRSAWDV